MKYQLTKELLDNYYSTLYNQFKTGKDRITPQKFNAIKDAEFDLILKKINDYSYTFTNFKSINLPTNREVYIPTIRDRLVIEFLKDKLKQKYRVSFPNRDDIIKSILLKFDSKMDYYVIRLDIKSFFNSIRQNKLLYKIKNKSLLSSQEYYLLKEFLKRFKKGLPQGLPASNALSEIYMESFDQELKQIHPRMNYYCRYVDDILIIMNGSFSNKEVNIIKEKITSIFKSHTLEINENELKYKFTQFPLKDNTSSTFDFTYLGYKFLCHQKKVTTTISQQKIDKFKEKIIYCFEEFKTNHNLELLIQRLDFLTQKNAVIKKETFITPKNKIEHRKKKICFGFIENYKYISKNKKADIAKEIDELLIMQFNNIKYILNSNLYGINTELKNRLYSISLSCNMNKFNAIYRYKKEDYVKKLLAINLYYNRNILESLTYSELSRLYFKQLKYSYLIT
ncbi:reverse transcriptase domain-containing protein [Bacillus cereus]|uniref:antiviral reverse transcriptase Drt3a n=1 Tax=Bacillus thuringiensis TaxID=1428 RepID=UPI0015964664|nr:antiviral reverse transcriptase Drt3a [Bacillus thuringiensis]MDA2412988.1 reverse transcriptase domain-containing protein [Bacillus cereus]